MRKKEPEVVEEEVSAIVDGEVQRNKQALIIEQMSLHGDLASTWARYHMIGDILRSDMAPVIAEHGIAPKVEAAIAQEPSITLSRWQRFADSIRCWFFKKNATV